MKHHVPPASRAARGFSLVEVLIAMVVLAFGLLALAGLMVRSQRSEMESYQRSQALLLLNEMYERINANRPMAACYDISNAGTGEGYFGTGSTLEPACDPALGTAAQRAQAVADLVAWDARLKGNSERNEDDVDIGAMVGARGCISYATGTELTDTTPFANTIAGTGIYTVSVAWKGLGEATPNTTLLCGTGQYGKEELRRVVSLTFRIGAINNTL